MRTKLVLSVFLTMGFISLNIASAAKPEMGPELPISKQMQTIERQDLNTVHDAMRLMGHLSFASQALDVKMKKLALENLSQAKALCARLERSRPEVISKYEYKYGKSTLTINNVDRDYYIPVADDVSVDGQVDEKAMGKKNPKVEEKGISIVHSSLQLNLTDVASAVKSAEKLTKVGKFAEASNALDGVFKDAVASAEVVTNPVWTVWGNLVLARDFLKSGQYKSARFAIGTVKSDLAKLEKDGVLTKSGDEAKELNSDLDEMQKTIDQKDPSLIHKMHAKLDTWSTKVKSWM